MENDYLGKNIINFNWKLVSDTYSAIFSKKLKFMKLYCILVGLLGVFLIIGEMFNDQIHTKYVGMILLFMVIIVFTSFIKSKRNIKKTILNTFNANNTRITTVLYYEDKIHISSNWNKGYSEQDIDYAGISVMYISKTAIVLFINHNTQILNVVKETLEGISVEQIIQKIKINNPYIKIIHNN